MLKPATLNQSLMQTRHSTIWGVNDDLKGSTTLLPRLKADSEATVDAGIANTSLAIFERMGYLGELTLREIKPFFMQSYVSSKYRMEVKIGGVSLRIGGANP